MNYHDRIEAVKDHLIEHDADAFLLTGADNTYYFAGFETHGEGDYPMVLIPAEGEATLLVSGLDQTAAKNAALPFTVPDGRFSEYLHDRFEDGTIMATPNMSLGFYNKLADELTVTVESDLIDDLRAVKSPEEVERIRDAYELTENSLEAVIDQGVLGKTEAEVAAELAYTMQRNGANGTAFPSIVGSGPASAVPHHLQSSTEIGDGPLLFDIGAQYNGYAGDLSRTVYIGEPSDSFREAYTTVLEAHEQAVAALASSVPVKDVHAAAVEVITEAGYDAFPHATGHGVGIAVHENPVLSDRSDAELAAGNVVTIEPGIYIEGEFGIRIEDAYHVTENGAERLTETQRDLRVLD